VKVATPLEFVMAVAPLPVLDPVALSVMTLLAIGLLLASRSVTVIVTAVPVATLVEEAATVEVDPDAIVSPLGCEIVIALPAMMGSIWIGPNEKGLRDTLT